MNRRLKQLYSLLPKEGKGIIDVGTDHGFIPIQLVKDHYPGAILASDIAPGPLNSAKALAKKENLDHLIQFLLCDGLEQCPPDQVDCILIAGMGGDTICRILDNAEWLFSDSYTLILQPMTHAEVVRYWLLNNEYKITREAVTTEDSQVYQMFAAVPGTQPRMDDYEYYIGSMCLAREGEGFDTLVAHQLNQITKKIDGLTKASGCKKEKIQFFQNIMRQLEELACH